MNLIDELSQKIEECRIKQAQMRKSKIENIEQSPEWRYLDGKAETYFELIDILRKTIG